MKNLCFSLAIVFLFLAIPVSAQVDGTGTVTTSTRTISGVNEVVMNLNGNLILTQGSSETLSIETHPNLEPLILTTVSNGLLTITSSQPIGNGTVNINLGFTNLTTLVGIQGNVSSSAQMSFTDINIRNRGTGNFDLDLTVSNQMNLTLQGTGNIVIKGTCKDHIGKSSNSGDYKSFALVSENGTIDNNGSGLMEVHCTQLLTAKTTSTGSIIFAPVATMSINSQTVDSGRISPAPCPEPDDTGGGGDDEPAKVINITNNYYYSGCGCHKKKSHSDKCDKNHKPKGDKPKDDGDDDKKKGDKKKHSDKKKD